MEPRFIDGQIIFIKKKQTLEIGEIGIFEINGDAYLKRLGHGEFISLNQQYKPISIHEFDSIHVFGKVIC
jgi:SOS-response transcriptional repressor LexA